MLSVYLGTTRQYIAFVHRYPMIINIFVDVVAILRYIIVLAKLVTYTYTHTHTHTHIHTHTHTHTHTHKHT